MNNKLTLKSQNIFCFLVLWIWVQDILLQYVRAVIMRMPIIGGYSDVILTIVFALIIAFSLPCFRININDLILIFAIVAVFALEYLFYKDGTAYLSRYLVSFIVKILPLYFVGTNLYNATNKEKIVYYMYLASTITLLTAIVYRFTFADAMSDAVSKYVGDMDFAYKLLPHCCLIAYYAVKKTNLLNLICAIIGGLYLLMLGTRGAALLYLALFAFLLITGRTSKKVVVRTVVIFGIVGGFLASPWYNTAVLWMYHKAQQFGLSIRIFDKLMSGEFTASGGRDTIKEILLVALKENPYVGYGICSDRVLAGNYAHNLALELWVEFGVIVGTAILVLTVVAILRGYRAANGEIKALILALTFASFFKLFLSGSYLDERLLMLLLGLCVCSIRKSKPSQTTATQRYLINARSE